MAGSDEFSVEWFTKPPGHSSPMHDHENEQTCLCLAGELTVSTETDTAVLGEYDSVWLASGESHRVENTGSVRAVGSTCSHPLDHSTSGSTGSNPTLVGCGRSRDGTREPAGRVRDISTTVDRLSASGDKV